jgi:hypothetical protein
MANSMSASFNAGYNNGTSNPPSRPDSAFDPAYSQYGVPPMQAANYPALIGTIGGSRLSPDANEFDVSSGMGPSPWNSQVRSTRAHFLAASVDLPCRLPARAAVRSTCHLSSP